MFERLLRHFIPRNDAKMVSVLIAAIWAFNPIVAFSQPGENSITITMLSPDFVEHYLSQPPEYHFFGGQNVHLPLIVEYEGEDVPQIRADVAQLGYSLKAPSVITADIISPVKEKRILSCRFLVSLEIPEVEKKTSFEMILQAKRESDEAWQDVNKLTLHVYPRDILKPLQKWSKNVHVRLKDQDGHLTNIFENHNVEFTDYRSAMPKEDEPRPVITFIAGEHQGAPLERRLERANETLIVFYKSDDTMPKVIVRPYQAGRKIEVYLPLLDSLENDPLSQMQFLEIVRLSQTLEFINSK